MILKEKPEDFIVVEEPKITLEPGPYIYVKITKKNRTTLDIVKYLEIKYKTRIGFAGTKDKHAITTQYVSLYKIPPEKIEHCNIDNATIELVGTGKVPLTLGNLKGNHFTIIVRDTKKREIANQDIENYYDEQRFSTNNAKIGKGILTKELQKACKMMQEKSVDEFLVKKPSDYVGAIKTLHKKQILLYIHAYQSFLFNEALKDYIKTQTKDYREMAYSQGTLLFTNTPIKATELPLPAFDMPDCPYYERMFYNYRKLKEFLMKARPSKLLKTL